MWDKVKGMVSGAAPLLGGLLGGPAGAAAGKLVADALGVEEDTDKIMHALQTDPKAMTKLRVAEMDHKQALRRMTLEAETKTLTEINKTMRAELQHDGVFKSGWRPFIGWIVGLGIGGILLALVVAMFKHPEKAEELISSATIILSITLGILGVNIKKRSDDKAVAQGFQPRGTIDAIKDLMGRK